MKFENGRLLLFEVSFFSAYYLLLSVAVLCGISLHHQITQYKVQTMFFLVFFQLNGERIQKLQFLPVVATSVAPLM